MSLPAVDISSLAIDQVLSRLSDNSAGINAMWAQQAVPYRVDPSLLSIDFVSDPSKNFCIGQVEPEELERSGNIAYPYMCMYVLESAHQGLTKFSIFSGQVMLVIDTYFAFRKMSGLRNFEKYSLCMESSMISLVNAWDNQNWGAGLTYNGGIKCRRGRMTFQAENWRQQVGFSLIFQVDKYSG